MKFRLLSYDSQDRLKEMLLPKENDVLEDYAKNIVYKYLARI